MLTCISCSKQVAEGDDDEVARGATTPRSKEAVKSFATQIKEMAQKLKPCTGSTAAGYKKGSRPFPEFDTISEGIPYHYTRPGPASSSSTPAWDFGDSVLRGAPCSSQAPGGQVSGGRPSVTAEDMLVKGEDGLKEWMAQVEPGVHITFASLPNGGNDLRRIRFR
uniref:BRX domain-containing protein n=1 Tax=Kalanchoe fedtschenkoi TaxID=63787 RepID=A0A7N0V823_KALFE